MRKKLKTGFIATVLLTVTFGGWHVGTRWQTLRKLHLVPEMTHRLAIVPTQLNLSDANSMPGVTCNIGYAEFFLESSDAIDLYSESAGVRGRTSSISFIFVPPFDPSTGSANDFKEQFSLLPQEHPLRHKLSDPSTTFLDFEIYVERLVPKPLWKAVFLNHTDFTLHTTMLALKASNTGGGMHSVYTYHTSDTIGLIRIGKTSVDKSFAHVYIENRSRTQGVGMVITMHDRDRGDVLRYIPTLLKTFRFTVEHLDSRDETMMLFAQAGIQPMEQQNESPTR